MTTQNHIKSPAVGNNRPSLSGAPTMDRVAVNMGYTIKKQCNGKPLAAMLKTSFKKKTSMIPSDKPDIRNKTHHQPINDKMTSQK